MKLGPLALDAAHGAILVHTTHKLPKGRRLDAADIERLRVAGLTEVMCAQLDEHDVMEDTAASAVAHALSGDFLRVDAPKTGRANVRAARAGLFVVDASTIARGNQVDESITIATLPDARPVRDGEIVATVKIIPFAVRGSDVAAACAALRSRIHETSAIRVAPWQPRGAGLVLTTFPATAPAILDRAAAAVRTRMHRLAGDVTFEYRVAHELDAVAHALRDLAREGCDPILALGASAIMDRQDVIPSALVRAGGRVTRFGMPVDPGNLLLLGELGTATVIGLPGCARSLARSGFDWVLERVVAGLPIEGWMLAELGVGGLLDEAARPSPRDAQTTTDASRGVAAVVLAAGTSSRMGANKLLVELGGVPLVRHAVTAALASHARPVVVVTGNDDARVREALAGLDVVFVHNAEFATGMASSLRAGIAATGDVAGALVCLGDMPRVTADHLAVLIGAFEAARDDGAIVVPTHERKRGNPVLWGRRRFADIAGLTGDVGARALIERYSESVQWVAIDDPAILLDVDTPDALTRLRG